MPRPYRHEWRSGTNRSMRLKDKVVIVTGSTMGIGEATARRCVAEGARVVVHGLERERGEKVVQSLGPQAVLHISDLADPKAPAALAEAAAKAFGAIDALVNNAAWVARSNLDTTSAERFDRVMAINLRAPLLLIQACLPHLKRSKGAVLNIGSVNAHCGEPNLLDYSISKGGLMTLTRNLADALAPHHVRVNQINPGWVLTENEYKLKLADGLPADWPEKLPEHLMPFGRLIKPEEIASAVVHWISDESYPFTGAVTDVNTYPMIGRNPPKEVK